MDVTVDIHNIGETSIPSVIPTKPIYQTDIFANEEEGVEEVIQAIFKANLPPSDIPLKELDIPCK